MKRPEVILSCFDGASNNQVALNRAGIRILTYYASEIDQDAIKVAQANFPNTIQIGDIRNLNPEDFKHVTVITAGSPCQEFSMCGSRDGMTIDKEFKITTFEYYMHLKRIGYQFDPKKSSYLFWEFVRLYRGIRDAQIREGLPVLRFLLENVKMPKEWENVITEAMGVKPHIINSSLVSAQNRLRYYWTNLDIKFPPKDKNITIQDVIPEAVAAAGKRGRKLPGKVVYSYPLTIRKDGKANCVVTKPDRTNLYLDKFGDIKQITPEHAEMLQTMDVGYTNVDGVSKANRYKIIGNAWTVDVIKHLYENGLK